jgi:hypothetical protein
MKTSSLDGDFPRDYGPAREHIVDSPQMTKCSSKNKASGLSSLQKSY